MCIGASFESKQCCADSAQLGSRLRYPAQVGSEWSTRLPPHRPPVVGCVPPPCLRRGLPVWSPFALAVSDPWRSVATRASVEGFPFILAVAVLPSTNSPRFFRTPKYFRSKPGRIQNSLASKYVTTTVVVPCSRRKARLSVVITETCTQGAQQAQARAGSGHHAWFPPFIR